MTVRLERLARQARRLGAIVLVSVTAAGCITGRVLEGYPGYPFVQFDTSLPVDSAFFAVQRAVVAEGFALDFTELASGAVNTRPAKRLGRDVFLNIVVAAAPDSTRRAPARVPTRVWIAGYEVSRGGAERINPLAKDAWKDLVELAAGVSRRVAGTSPRGPPPAS